MKQGRMHVSLWLAVFVTAIVCGGACAARAQDSAVPVVSSADSGAVEVPALAPASAPETAALPNQRPVVGRKLVELTGKGENVVRSGPGARCCGCTWAAAPPTS